MISERKLGRKPAKRDPRTLKLSSFLVPTLPKPPASRDWTDGRKWWGKMCNDRLGCCTISAIGHAIQVWTAQVSSEVTVPDAVIEMYYRDWAGYNPADPSTDQGAYELDILNAWRNKGFAGSDYDLIAYMEPNPQDEYHVKQALCLFGGLYIGLDLPNSCQFQQVWDVVKGSDGGSWGGHAVYAVAYDEEFITCITWGYLQKMTWEFWRRYCFESHALLCEPWLYHFGGMVPINAVALQNALKTVSGR